jgi:hypothetical protein
MPVSTSTGGGSAGFGGAFVAFFFGSCLRPRCLSLFCCSLARRLRLLVLARLERGRRADRVEHRGDVEHLVRRVDDAGKRLVHEHALDRERIGCEREADLARLEPVDVEEVFLERVVHRAQRAHRRIARIAELRVLAAGGMHREATRCRDLAGANRQVRAAHQDTVADA